MSCCLNRVDGQSASGGGSSPLPSQGVLVAGIDGVTVTGTTNTSVVIWSGASTNLGTVALGDWLTRVDSATLGTTFTLTAGIYYVCFLPVMLNAADAIVGVSYNATAGQLTTPPDGTTTQYAARVDFRQPSGIATMQADGIIQVTEADVTGGTNIVRAQMTNSGAAPAPAVVIVAACAITISRIGESA